VTTLPLKAIKLLPNMDAVLGNGIRSGMRDSDYKLTLLVESALVRVESKLRPGTPIMIPLVHVAFLEPAPTEAAPAAVKK
jgi:hypothetical protein